MVCALIYNDIRHHKGQNLLWTDSAAPRDTTTFFCDDDTVMTNVVVNNSIDHAKPMSSYSLALPSRTLRFKTKK